MLLSCFQMFYHFWAKSGMSLVDMSNMDALGLIFITSYSCSTVDLLFLIWEEVSIDDCKKHAVSLVHRYEPFM